MQNSSQCNSVTVISTNPSSSSLRVACLVCGSLGSDDKDVRTEV